LAARYVINDLNSPREIITAQARGGLERTISRGKPLVELWQAIIESPEKLARQYETLWRAQHEDRRQYYDQVRGEFNRTGRPDCFLYLLARCVKASVRYNANGEFNQSPDNRRLGALPETMREHNYSHVAMREARRADILWTGAEVESYERLKKRTLELQKNIPAYVKEIVEQHLNGQGGR
jgi:site-specific DNA-adenine methylase